MYLLCPLYVDFMWVVMVGFGGLDVGLGVFGLEVGQYEVGHQIIAQGLYTGPYLFHSIDRMTAYQWACGK